MSHGKHRSIFNPPNRICGKLGGGWISLASSFPAGKPRLDATTFAEVLVIWSDGQMVDPRQDFGSLPEEKRRRHVGGGIFGGGFLFF